MPKPILSVRALQKSFGALRVCRDLSFDCPAGATLGIIGPNGAGKSTLFNMLTGTLAPDRGEILFGGKDISHLPPESRCRAGIARSWQIPRPFAGLTVFENLLVAADFGAGEGPAEARDHCRDLLDRLGLLPLADRRAGALRLLDRKRLELARALASRPRLLLMDEIAGGLSDAECDTLVGTIRDIRAEGVTIIWIEHVVDALMAVIDRLMVLDFGVKIAEGAPREVFASAPVQKIYLGIEA